MSKHFQDVDRYAHRLRGGFSAHIHPLAERVEFQSDNDSVTPHLEHSDDISLPNSDINHIPSSLNYQGEKRNTSRLN